MNAALTMLELLRRDDPRPLAERYLRQSRVRASGADGAEESDVKRHRVLDRRAAESLLRNHFVEDLAGLLNLLDRQQLMQLCNALRVAPTAFGVAPTSVPGNGALRLALWMFGANHEARCGEYIGTPLQPAPKLVAETLVMHAPARGDYSPCTAFPRSLPADALPSAPEEEPQTVEELLDAAQRLIGVRLGPRGQDKGAWGQRAARLLGVNDTGANEPDWRGDVEIKTVPARMDSRGYWRIVEDPAICMASNRPMAKLMRVLWLVRVTLSTDEGDVSESALDDATIISWYFLEADELVLRCAKRDLHQRPKGPRGTDQRGWYLHKRFFADVGLLATLNGASTASIDSVDPRR
jgi:hypothetical protein